MQQRSSASITNQVKLVRTRMESMAERSSASSVKVMRKYAQKVRERAAWYAPEDTGALGDVKNWAVEENRDGLNGRLTFTVRIKKRASMRKNGRSIPITRYAGYMHNGDYKIRGKGRGGVDLYSRAKANRSAPAGQKRLSKYPVGSGSYVGRLFLTRASAQYRLIVNQEMNKAIAKELR